MIYTRPYITKRFIAYEGDSHTAEVSLAVQVVDAFTDQPPLVPFSVRLKELPLIRPLRGESGAYCFEGKETVMLNGVPKVREPIPPGNYTLIVEPDPTSGNWYNLQPKLAVDPSTDTFERPVVLPITNPPELVTFSPTGAYPFPANATLVRGTVFQGGAKVPTAEVSTTYDQVDPADPTQTIAVVVRTITDRAGAFVLFFKSLPDKTQPITIQAVKNGPPSPINITIEEGKTLTNQDITLP